MPRRISDYPDAFAGWNLVSSFGSIISVVATWLFLYIVYIQLVEGKATSRYPWLTSQFYNDSLQTLLNRSYNSLEWALSSPPKPHAFISLPLQSILGLIIYNFLCNPKVIIYRFIILFILGTLFKSSLAIYLDIPYTSIEFIITSFMSIIAALLTDIYVLLPSPLALFNFFVYGINIFKDIELPKSFKINSFSEKKLPLFSSQDITESKSSVDPQKGIQNETKIEDIFYVDSITKEYNNFKEELSKVVKGLKERLDLLEKNLDLIATNKVSSEKVVSGMLEDQLMSYNGVSISRIRVGKINFPSLPLDVKNELLAIEKEFIELNRKVVSDINKINKGYWRDDMKNIKIFFDTMNAYRNKSNKIISKFDRILHESIKTHMAEIYKIKDFRQLVNTEVPKTVKEVVDQDSYLKKRIGEIIKSKS